jgi:peptide chain release factor 1
VHTSTVTVVVLAEPNSGEFEIDPRDLDEKFTRGSGKGGQHRNKTDTAVQLRHKPSGLSVRVENGRSQAANRDTALRLLRARLSEAKQQAQQAERHRERREQAGSGQRGDKIRTIALQRDQVTDHRSGRSCSVRDYMRGKLSSLVGSS